MFHPLRLLLVGFLMIGLASTQRASAQDDDDDSEETVIETEDGRIIIIEEDTDGDRPHIEHRIIRRPGMNRFLERGVPHMEHRGEIIFRDEDGNERRFTMDGDDVQWHGHDDAAVTDTTIDGQRVIIIRTPDGNEEIIDLDGMGENAFAFRMPNFDMPNFDMPNFDHNFEFDMPEGHEMRLRMFGEEGMNAFAFGPNFMHLEGMMGASAETRREMMELERQSMEIAARVRHDEGGERAELERELDDVLAQLFELRGQARAERAGHMEEQAEELRHEAQELRESLNDRNRERQNLIDERKRELLGEHGSDW